MSTVLQEMNQKARRLEPKRSPNGNVNIKNAEATRMIRELAALEGVSLVAAVAEAVKEKLERERTAREAAERPRKSRSELLMEFAEQCAPLFKDGRSGNELINDLYDEETGLPK
jgi:hypothetical protein